MSDPRLILVHGWGFGPDFWAPLQAHLSGVAVERADLGFFGPAVIPPWDGHPTVAVGHSLGLAWLLRNVSVPLAGLVSIAGFPRFTRTADLVHGVDSRLLRHMERRFRRDPAATVHAFYDRCAAPDYRPPVDLAHADHVALAAGLHQLGHLDVRPALAHFSKPILALAAWDDAIVPSPLTAAVFGARPHTTVHWAEQGGHALPWTQPAWCARLIRGFTEEVL